MNGVRGVHRLARGGGTAAALGGGGQARAGQCPSGPREDLQGSQRLGDAGTEAVAQQARGRRHCFGIPTWIVLGAARAVGREVEQVGHQGNAGDAVDDGVMHPKHHGGGTAGEAFEQRHLPKRPIPGQTPTHQLADVGGQVIVGCGLVEPVERKVMVEVEVGVVDPAGPVGAEGHGCQSPAEGWNQRHPVRHVCPQRGRIEAVRGG